MIRGYCDFNFFPQPSTVASVKNLCEAALADGYGTVAINTKVDVATFESRKKQKKKQETRVEGDIFPAPMQLDALKEEFKGKLEILQRLTVPISENLQVHKMFQSKNLALYDLLAVLPLTPVAFQNACSIMEIDLITYEPSSSMNCRITRKLVRQAADRGVHFELQYSPCVLDPTARCNTITLSHTLHAVGRAAACIIISSGAEHPSHLRSPYDVMNLGLLFGLSEERAKGALTHSCRSLLLRAQARRNAKAVVSACSLTSLPPNEAAWRSQHAEDDEDLPPAKRSRGPDKA